MTEGQRLQKIREEPTIIKIEGGKDRYRTSTGRWSTAALARHIASNSETMFDYKEIARIGFGYATPANADEARKKIRLIANFLEDDGIAAVVEFSGRKLHAIQRYNPNNEYHQTLMAAEINRRQLRQDGSEQKLQRLIGFLPHADAS